MLSNSTITIFNNKTTDKIIIEISENVFFHPKFYDPNPSAEIIFNNGFDLLRHSESCLSCKNFLLAFGTATIDWCLLYDNKTYRLDLSTLNGKDISKNQIKYSNSEFLIGTTIKLFIHKIPTDKEGLKASLEQALLIEDYELACLIRDV
jgi:hypothetical protein